MEELETEAAKRDQMGNSNVFESVKWMREIAKKLSFSNWIADPRVTKLYEEFISMISCKQFSRSSHDIKNYPSHYLLVPRLISHKVNLKFPYFGFVGPCLNMLYAVSERLVKLEEKELFSDWADIVYDQNQKQYQFTNLILPSFVQDYLSNHRSGAISDWLLSRDTEISVLYQHLRLLSTFDEYKKTFPTINIFPATW